MSEGGFGAVADLIDDDFTMDSPHGIEAHNKAGLEEWFQVIFHLSRVRGGRIVRLTTHSTKDDALEAAGKSGR
jgi:hypothetical protein